MFIKKNHLKQIHFVNISINSKQKILRPRTISKNIFTDNYNAILWKQLIKIANKVLKKKEKNFRNTKLQHDKI